MLLTRFATGEIAMSPAITVSAHLNACERCRERVRAIEDLEGRRMELSAPAPLSEGALERVLARVKDEPFVQNPLASPDVAFLGDVQLPRAAAVAGFRPRRWLGPGLWTARMNGPRDADWRTFLLRAPGGTRIPDHGHHATELIAVLSGSLFDGRTYVAGDFVENDRQVHRLAVSADRPCACLISTQGPLKWRGWNRLIGLALGI